MTEELNTKAENTESNANQLTPIEKHKNDEATGKSSSKINPALLALNVLMLIGLIILYVLHFTGGKTSNTMSGALEKASSGTVKVAFVNNDSILTNYELVKKMRADLQAKGLRFEKEIAAKQAAFEKDAAYFQEQVQKKTISEQSAQEIYLQLQQNQQKVYDMRDKLAAELQQSEMDMNVALLDSVMNFLQRYNEKYKFDYILGFNKGGNILLANDTLDLTKNVLEEMNIEYQKKHGGK